MDHANYAEMHIEKCTSDACVEVDLDTGIYGSEDSETSVGCDVTLVAWGG